MEANDYSGMTAIEKLNFFRNCHYSDGMNTELGIIADALNEVLPHYARIWSENVANNDSRIDSIIAKVRKIVASQNKKSLEYCQNIVKYNIAQVFSEEDEVDGITTLKRIEFWNETGNYHDKVIATEDWIVYIPEIGSGMKRKIIAEYDGWNALMEM